MWRAQVAALAGAGEVLAPDLPGHGRASEMKPCRSMDEMARYLAGMLEQPRQALATDLEAMKERPGATPDLAGIAVPTLVLVGDGDEVRPPSVAREMADAIPGSRLAVSPGAAHLGPVQQPQAVNA